MTLISVVLPEPLGPTRPKISPSRTSRSTPASACRPPKRLVTARTSRMVRSPIGCAVAGTTGTTSALCLGGRGPALLHPVLDRGNDAVGQPQDGDDQDQADDGAADHRLAAADEGIEQGGDDGGADRRAEPVARAAEHAHQHDIERHRELERAGDREEADIHRMDAAHRAGDAGREREGQRACSGRSARPWPRPRPRRRGWRTGPCRAANGRPSRRSPGSARRGRSPGCRSCRSESA